MTNILPAFGLLLAVPVPGTAVPMIVPSVQVTADADYALTFGFPTAGASALEHAGADHLQVPQFYVGTPMSASSKVAAV
ncbi:MAG: hypothetical protein P1U53_11470 [Sulfitobacter sp.]|nr:hypothetical protein [Sulfitobacter sp.]